LGGPSFEDFVRARARDFQRAAYLLTGDWYAAEELVQTALATVWLKWDSIADKDSARTYVNRVLLNAFLRQRRRRWIGEIPSAAPPDLPGPGHSHQTELRESIRAALDSLSGRQRAVIVLRYFCDLSDADVADALGCSVSAVKAHTARALTALSRNDDVVTLLKEHIR
jgi:RNA polymerase sigma-70 factor (sigma-E family)